MHPELARDVAEVDTARGQCLNGHEVLRSQHDVPPFRCAHRWSDIPAGDWGTSYFGVFLTYSIGTDSLLREWEALLAFYAI